MHLLHLIYPMHLIHLMHPIYLFLNSGFSSCFSSGGKRLCK